MGLKAMADYVLLTCWQEATPQLDRQALRGGEGGAKPAGLAVLQSHYTDAEVKEETTSGMIVQPRVV